MLFSVDSGTSSRHVKSAKEEVGCCSEAFGELGVVVVDFGVGGRRSLVLLALSSTVSFLELVALLFLGSSVSVASVCWDCGSIGTSLPGVGSLGVGL